MDVLSVGGKDYVKASVIARDLGYTADYVGQLCRSRKVDAKLVGRSWYVDRNSIHLHRTNRYRSTQAKSIASLKEDIAVAQVGDEESYAVPIHVGSAPAALRHSKKPAYIAYSEDPTDLIPTVSKNPVSIPVNLADAKEVSVTSTSEKYVFQTPELPSIQFQGKLTVNNIDDEIIDEKGERGRILHPTWVFGKSKKKAKNLVNSSVKKEITAPEENLHTSALVSDAPLKKGKNKSVHLEVEGNPGDAHMRVTLEEIEDGRPVSKLMLFAATVVSLALVVLTFCSEQSITAVDGSQTVSYSVALENLSASAYTAYEDFSRVENFVEFSTNFLFF